MKSLSRLLHVTTKTASSELSVKESIDDSHLKDKCRFFVNACCDKNYAVFITRIYGLHNTHIKYPTRTTNYIRQRKMLMSPAEKYKILNTTSSHVTSNIGTENSLAVAPRLTKARHIVHIYARQDKSYIRMPRGWR
jgi:hypothetical protein